VTPREKSDPSVGMRTKEGLTRLMAWTGGVMTQRGHAERREWNKARNPLSVLLCPGAKSQCQHSVPFVVIWFSQKSSLFPRHSRFSDSSAMAGAKNVVVLRHVMQEHRAA